jgi:hypothetical protein
VAATRSRLRRERRISREALAGIAFVAAIAYVLLLNLPLLDTRFNALASHPEDYAAGSFGLAVNGSYLALAIAIESLAVSLLPVRGWSIAVPALLVPAGLVCGALAFDPIGVARANAWVLVPIVGLALVPAITMLTMRDRFRPCTPAVAGVGIAALLALCALVLSPDSVSGLVNRVLDVLIAAWIATASAALRSRALP